MEIFDFFLSLLNMGITILSMPSFEIAGLEVTYFDLMIGFLAISLVISVFWKGARA